MKILDIKHVHDCFDGSHIKEVLFDESITEEFIESLSEHGKLNYYKTLARPFFKVLFQGGFYMKGVQGNQTARITVQTNHDIDYIRGLFNRA